MRGSEDTASGAAASRAETKTEEKADVKVQSGYEEIIKDAKGNEQCQHY